MGDPGYDGWGQVGFERTVGFSMRWFAQYNSGYFDGLDTRYSTFPVDGQVGIRHTFRVLWNFSCVCLIATIDTTNWLYSQFNPYSSAEANWGPQPWSPQFHEESAWTKSYVPGLASTPVLYSGMGAQRYSDDTLELMPCILSGAIDSSIWRHHAFSCTSFNAWTAP